MDEYGQRVPDSHDIEALAMLIEAHAKHGLLTPDTQHKMDSVVATYCKSFKSTDND